MGASPPVLGESVCNVVVEDIESSTSEFEDEVGETARRGEASKFFDRIFWVILVSENGRA